MSDQDPEQNDPREDKTEDLTRRLAKTRALLRASQKQWWKCRQALTEIEVTSAVATATAVAESLADQRIRIVAAAFEAARAAGLSGLALDAFGRTFRAAIARGEE